MDDPLQPLEVVPLPLAPPRPSLLIRAAIYTLVPILVVLALPLLLMIILVIYLLALIHGGRVFVFSWSGKSQEGDAETELTKPHFLEIQGPAEALPDESASDHKETNC
jgi:hypothetical protein